MDTIDSNDVVEFKQWRCRVETASYQHSPKEDTHDRIALKLIDLEAEDWDPGLIAVATVNIPDCHLEPDEVLIKNWSENSGIFQALIKSGYISPTGVTVPTGHVRAIKARLTEKSIALLPDSHPLKLKTEEQ